MKAESVAHPVDNFSHNYLWSHILAPDTAHYLATNLWRELIWNNFTPFRVP